jgi:DNA-binding transcriptional MerR regulator
MNALGSAQKSPEAFRTISEVAAELDVPQHVLRFWETKFATVKPLKRGGGRRYYRPDDLDLLRGIRALLYSDGLTIKGVQKILREQGVRYVMELGRGAVSLVGARAESADIADETSAEPAGAAEPASNVHPFPRETDTHFTMAEDERARFAALLDELTQLKTRLREARRVGAVPRS